MLNLFRQVLFITIMNVTRNDVIGNVCCQAITVCMKSQRFLCYSQGTQHTVKHIYQDSLTYLQNSRRPSF